LFSKSIREIPYRINEKLPERVRLFLRPVVHAFSALNKVFFLASQLQTSAYLLRGKEKWSHENLSTLFLGDEKGLYNVSEMLYGEEPAKESLGRVFLWQMNSRTPRRLPQADLLLIRTPDFFADFLQRRGFMIIPEWVLFMLDLSKSFPEAWNLKKNKSLRENLREFRKHRYSCEITSDPEMFEHFYHRMYLPHATQRFGKLTFTSSYQSMKIIFRRGWLLLVKKENECVSASLMAPDGDTLLIHSLGVTDGKSEYLKTGALTALYYFNIMWAKEQGYAWIDFGHCRSLLRDGVFKHKKRWGMSIRSSTRLRNILCLKICNLHPGVRTALAKNPFIFIEKKKLNGFIMAEQQAALSREEVQSLVNAHAISGLDQLVIVCPRGFTQQAREFADSCATHRVRLIQSMADSADAGGAPAL